MNNDSVKINIDDQKSVERILKRFKRMCESYGVVRECKRRQAYIKPSIAEKEKRKSADKRRKKAYTKMRFSGERI